MYRILFFCLLCSSLLCAAAPQTRVLHYPQPESDHDERSRYPLLMLRLALDKAQLPYELRPSTLRMQQNRALAQLQQGQIDVFWSMTSIERERELLPIRIPLDRGLYGCRLLLIRANEQARFSAIKERLQLAQMRAVQGHDWPDTEILQSNGLQVMSAARYEMLFEMLRKSVVDYFPRAAIEIQEEARRWEQQGLRIEQELILEYPTALYFFVNKKDSALAQALEQGLQSALKDGSFERLYMQFHGDMIRQLRLSERRKIRLNNPLLPPLTPLPDKAPGNKDLWLQY
ncbi:transporter substrate-binding domain-containing protein [Massilia sp. W12]|uniref:substrate-binding periplasmic protein n=1 Tax=Massilia sp. W12 TaxID=3126507 RepID=UPI0030CD074C